MRPLYRTESEPQRDNDGHAGLWFDRFCNEWREDGGSWTMGTRRGSKDETGPKLRWIKTLAGVTVGTQDQIEQYVLRLLRLIDKRGGLPAVFESDSRFVTGLGRSHPVENGFAWHSTLGTPYLPGSSVKGIIRAWAEAGAEPAPEPAVRKRLLGIRGGAGDLCFLDAVPVAPVLLDADVMTPHYSSWSADEPPGDWRSPTPIPFLTVAQGAALLFGVVPRRALAASDLDTVSAWLRDALEWAGGGAKTAVGYGRFHHDEEQTRQWVQRAREEERRRQEAEKREQAMKSPEGRWRIKLQGLSEAEVLDLVRVRLEREPLEDPRERQAFARAVPSRWIQGWRQGRKQDPQTGVGKKKLKERAALVDDVLAGSDSTPTV